MNGTHLFVAPALVTSTATNSISKRRQNDAVILIQTSTRIYKLQREYCRQVNKVDASVGLRVKENKII